VWQAVEQTKAEVQEPAEASAGYCIASHRHGSCAAEQVRELVQRVMEELARKRAAGTLDAG
jgi:hypothetical protein